MASQDQLFTLIEQLKRKIELLTKVYTSAQTRVKELETKNATLRKRLTDKQTQFSEFRKKHVFSEENTPMSKDVGIIVKDNLSETDTNAELKQQLDEYIREVERCIAHLSSLS